MGESSLTRLGNNVFSGFKNLELIEIHMTSIDYISENAFEFYQDSNQRLTLYLWRNSFFRNNEFAENSLTKFRRPTTIRIQPDSINGFHMIIQEKAFLPFLKSDDRNKIELQLSLDCDDCRNYWIKRNPNLIEQIINLSCENSKWNDPVNFSKCKTIF